MKNEEGRKAMSLSSYMYAISILSFYITADTETISLLTLVREAIESLRIAFAFIRNGNVKAFLIHMLKFIAQLKTLKAEKNEQTCEKN